MLPLATGILRDYGAKLHNLMEAIHWKEAIQPIKNGTQLHISWREESDKYVTTLSVSSHKVLASSAEDCSDGGADGILASVRCVPSYITGPSTQTLVYLRESFYCEDTRRCTMGNDDTITCSREWYYPYEYDPDYP